MRGILPVIPVLLAAVGAAVFVVLLWRRSKHERIAAAVREAAAHAEKWRLEKIAEEVERDLAEAAALDAPTVAVDPNPTRKLSALDDTKATSTQWLRPNLDQPTQTLPAVSAPRPRPAVPPIPVVPVDPDAPTPLAPDHWQHVQADPSDPTPLCPPEPVVPPEADWTRTQAFDRGRLFRILGNGRRDELDALRRDMESGATQ